MTVRVFTEAANAGSVDAATLATQLAVVDAKVQALDAATGFTILYPNGGSAAAPANVAANTRYVMPNPFPGSHVLCEVEVRLPTTGWFKPGWATNTTIAYGVSAGMAAGSLAETPYIVVQTGRDGVAGVAAIIAGTVDVPTQTTAQCRVKVWKMKGAM